MKANWDILSAFEGFAAEPALPVGDVTLDSIINSGAGLLPTQGSLVASSQPPSRAQQAALAATYQTPVTPQQVYTPMAVTTPLVLPRVAQADQFQIPDWVLQGTNSGPTIVAWGKNGNIPKEVAARWLEEWSGYQRAHHPTVLSDGTVMVSGKTVGKVAPPPALSPPPVPRIVSSDTPNRPINMYSADPVVTTAAPGNAGTSGSSSQWMTTLGNVLTTAASKAGDIYIAERNAKTQADLQKAQLDAQLAAAKAQAKAGMRPGAAPSLAPAPSSGGGGGFLSGLTKADNYQSVLRITAIVVIGAVAVVVLKRVIGGSGRSRYAE